jgi:hypothetical protein
MFAASSPCSNPLCNQYGSYTSSHPGRYTAERHRLSPGTLRLHLARRSRRAVDHHRSSRRSRPDSRSASGTTPHRGCRSSAGMDTVHTRWAGLPALRTPRRSALPCSPNTGTPRNRSAPCRTPHLRARSTTARRHLPHPDRRFRQRRQHLRCYPRHRCTQHHRVLPANLRRKAGGPRHHIRPSR